MRAVANRYVGLGAALGVPQSALEAMTSLDPKDYLYPQPSAAQQQAALQQLTNQGSMPPGHAAMGSSFGGQGGGYKSGFHPNSAGDPSYTGELFIPAAFKGLLLD